MRQLAIHTFPAFKLTIFAWNGKYLLKYEQEGLEQTYKVAETDLTSEADLQQIIQDEELQKQVLETFNQMRGNWYASLDKHL